MIGDKIMKTGIFISILIGLLLVLTTPAKSTGETQEETNSEAGQKIDDAYVVHPELPRITAKGLKQLIDKNYDHILVDSRDSASYDKGHIKGAINIYYDPVGDPMVREMSLMALPMDKLIIIYCDCEDDGISAGLAMELFDLGYDLDRIKILSRGIIRWYEMGYPVVAKEK